MGSRTRAYLLTIVLGLAGTGTLCAQAPPTPAPPAPKDIYLPAGESITMPLARKQTLRFSPRYGSPGSFDLQTTEPGMQRLVYIGGLIININYETDSPKGPVPQEYEFAADNLVIWIQGAKGGDVLNGVTAEPAAPGSDKMHIEMFLTGNVVVRNKDETTGPGGKKTVLTRTIRADQLYYDVEKSKAVALKADLEMKFDSIPDSIHFFGDRIERLGLSEWHATKAGAYSSKLPSDPALRLLIGDATLTEREGKRENFLGIPYRNIVSGDYDEGAIRRIEGYNERLTLLGVPIFYSPYMNVDVSEPLGPLRSFSAGNDRIFGAQIMTTWDIYKLIALRPPVGHDWSLHVDYLSDRGTGFGTDYNYSDKNFFGFGGPDKGNLILYGIQDRGTDILGGIRGAEPAQSDFRGRALWRHQQELFADKDADGMFDDRYLTFQAGFAYESDKNFLESYYKNEFDTGANQETFAFLSGSRGQFYGSLLVQDSLNRPWITQTEWLPNLNAAVVGQSFWDNIFQYEARASAAYGKLIPASQPQPAYINTDQPDGTGRLDLYQTLAVPFDLGPVRIRPYGVFDVTNYTSDLNGNDVTRVYGGGGVSAAMTVSRIYSEASSELFNVHGLNHKVTYWANYSDMHSNIPYTQLPQLDRLDDDAIDQSMRTIQPFFPMFIPGVNGVALQNSPQYNLQQYALRRLDIDDIDTRDTMEVVQTGIFQRLQTKRGQPGDEHTVDWMTLSLTASFFPNPARDDFGKNVALLEYNYLWNIGDQTALTATGWFDPYNPGSRYWTVGSYITRPDGLNFYLGYRQTDPLNSKEVTVSALYQLSKKYSVNVSSSYDFGTQLALSNSLTVFRTGTDLTIGFGITYNALVNNFGVSFVIVPNLLAALGYNKAGTPSLSR